MAQQKPPRHRENDSPRRRKVTLSDKRKFAVLNGYNTLLDFMVNGGTLPKK